jgi:hypothetical protein
MIYNEVKMTDGAFARSAVLLTVMTVFRVQQPQCSRSAATFVATPLTA